MRSEDNANKLKIRRSEIISGLTISSVILLYSSFRTISNDINKVIEAQTRVVAERHEQSVRAIEQLITRDRETVKETLDDLRQRVSWLERDAHGKGK